MSTLKNLTRQELDYLYDTVCFEPEEAEIVQMEFDEAYNALFEKEMKELKDGEIPF